MSQNIFFYLTKFYCLIAFTSRDIGQYVYGNCYLTTLWRHKTWDQPYLSNQIVLLHDRKFKTKIWISWERKELLRWNKKHFSSLLKCFQLPNIVSDLKVRSISRLTNIEGVYLIGTFKKDAIKANAEALSEYDQLQKEALFTPVSWPMSPGNLIIHSAQS